MAENRKTVFVEYTLYHFRKVNKKQTKRKRKAPKGGEKRHQKGGKESKARGAEKENKQARRAQKVRESAPTRTKRKRSASQRRTKREPKATKREPKANQRKTKGEPKAKRRDPKGKARTEREPRGNEGPPKRRKEEGKREAGAPSGKENELEREQCREYCGSMSLSKGEQSALRELAKRKRGWTLCEKEGGTPIVLRAGNFHAECNFDGWCFLCFLKGEFHWLKTRPGAFWVNCDEVLHDYYYHNTILTDEYPLAGMSAEEVQRAVVLIKLMRKGKGTDLFEETLRAEE